MFYINNNNNNNNNLACIAPVYSMFVSLLYKLRKSTFIKEAIDCLVDLEVKNFKRQLFRFVVLRKTSNNKNSVYTSFRKEITVCS